MQDITQRFKQACGDLPDGRLVKIEGLGMMEVMNALQIGDPRMDTGAGPSTSRHMYDPNQCLSAEEACWAIDHMTALEVAWYRGATLCQTAWTCIPCHRPDLFAEQEPAGFFSQALRTYFYAYLKTIDLAYAELSKGHVRDGEDVWLDHYGLPIELQDSVETVVLELERGVQWAVDADDPWTVELGKRFRLRAGIIQLLSSGPSAVPDIDVTLETAARPGRASLLFDPDMSRYLRQNMPLPAVAVPPHDEAVRVIGDILAEVRMFADRIHLDPNEVLTARHRRGPTLPLTWSLCKTCIMGHDSDMLFEDYIARQTGVDRALHRIHDEVQDTHRRQCAIWRDLVRGYYLNTCCAAFSNPCRRRRGLLSLSAAWHERAVMASTFGHTAARVAVALTALRLDCLLDAALGSLELGLVAPGEHMCTWWWIARVARERAGLQLATTWYTDWADLWAQIAGAMVHLLAISGPACDVSQARFEMRMKWPRKLPGLPDGTKIKAGLRPEFHHYVAFRQSLLGREREELVREAEQYLRHAQVRINLLRTWEKDVNCMLTLDDLAREITTIQSGKSQWDFATRGWLPRS